MNFNSVIDEWKDEIISSTQEIIKIKSVEDNPLPGKPFGEGVAQSLEYALNLADKMGFTTKNLDGYAGYAEYGQGEETLGILLHLDVVPEGDGWLYPPYGAEIHDGKIYGRGAVDDKGPAIAALYALKAVKESKVDFQRKVRIIFGTNEETNWGCMEHYLQKEASPDLAFVPDGDYPLINGEKGLLDLKFHLDLKHFSTDQWEIVQIKGGIRSNMVPDYCEVQFKKDKDKAQKLAALLDRFKQQFAYDLQLQEMDEKLIIKCYGLSAHGSLPEKGKNAISMLMHFLKELNLGNSAAGHLVDFYNKYIGMSYNGQLMGIDFVDDISGKLTFNAGVINFAAEKAEIIANIRIPITKTAEEVITTVEKNVQLPELTIKSSKKKSQSYYIPEDDLLVKKLLQVYQEQTGDYDAKPMTIGGATYARALKKAVPFGPIFPGEIQTMHEKNEYIEINSLLKSTKIYAQAIYELTR